MPIFEYKAFTSDGATKTGVVDADTPRDARQQVDWWCAQPETGRLAWLEVLGLGAAVRTLRVASAPFLVLVAVLVGAEAIGFAHLLVARHG